MDRRYHDAIHDAVVRVAEPGPDVAKMLDWCERYVDRELLTDPTDDRSLPPHQAARLAVEAYRHAIARAGISASPA